MEFVAGRAVRGHGLVRLALRIQPLVGELFVAASEVVCVFEFGR